MSKRRAGTELTHDNWDQEEEEQEEAGVFRAADKDIIAKRAIKKAKRRFAGDEQKTAGASDSPFAAFKGFSGFGATAATTKKPDLSFGATAATTKKPDLSFGATAATTKKPDLSFGVTDSKPRVAVTPAESTAPVISSFVLKTSSPTPKSSTIASSTSLNGSSSSSALNTKNMNSEYSKQLRSLNQSVSAWIQQHVNANPLCDLTPVFEDYKKHLGEIEEKYSKQDNTTPAESVTSTVPKPSSQLGTTATSTTSTSSSALGGFQFMKSTTSAPSQSTFSFKPTPATGTSSASSGFSFSKSSAASDVSAGGGAVGQVKPFSFGLAQPTSSSSNEGAKGSAGDADEPPKVEFKQVEEKDAVYSKRCKLFYKKDDSYKDRGVGMLHLKKTGDRGQILIRADTNLGNVILNVGVHPSMPATRQGKNNVLIMTAMNPPINEKCPQCNKKYPQPQESNRCETGCSPEVGPLLLRVKTGEDADQLLEEINKLKE